VPGNPRCENITEQQIIALQDPRRSHPGIKAESGGSGTRIKTAGIQGRTNRRRISPNKWATDMTQVRTAAILLMSSLMSYLACRADRLSAALDYAVVADQFQPARRRLAAPRAWPATPSHFFVRQSGPPIADGVRCNGKFIAPGRRLFARPHGIRIGPARTNIWTTERRARMSVYKLVPRGRICSCSAWAHRREMPLLRSICASSTSRTKWRSGRKRDLRGAGDGRGDPKVVKFDKDGNFIRVGQERTGPGEFDIGIRSRSTPRGCYTVEDRQNQRIQVFDADGKYMRESSILGPRVECYRFVSKNLWLAHGHAGRRSSSTSTANCWGQTEAQGKGPGTFGEAHFLAVSKSQGRRFVADTLNCGDRSSYEIPSDVCVGVQILETQNVNLQMKSGAVGKSATRLAIRLPGRSRRPQSGPSA